MLPASSPDHSERQAHRALIHGVYAITADEGDTTRLRADVEVALSEGIRILQYRNKHADRALKRQQLEALKTVCEQHQALLIVNDDWRLAAELGIDAVHLGEDDGDIEEARQALGPGSLIVLRQRGASPGTGTGGRLSGVRGALCVGHEAAGAPCPAVDLSGGAGAVSGAPAGRHRWHRCWQHRFGAGCRGRCCRRHRRTVPAGGCAGGRAAAGGRCSPSLITRVSAAARPARGHPFDPPARWHRFPHPSAAGSQPGRQKGWPSSARHPVRPDHPG